MQGHLTHPELSVAVEMLSSVALINRALDSGDMNTVWKQLSSAVTGLTNIEDENSQRWVIQGIVPVLDVAYILWLREFSFPSLKFYIICYRLDLIPAISCILFLELLFLTGLVPVLSLNAFSWISH